MLDPAQSTPTADSDGDGVPNLIEYGLGTHPKNARLEHDSPTATGLPTGSITGTGAERRLTLSFWIPADPTAAGLSFTGQFSSDGTTWTDVPSSAFSINPTLTILSSNGLRYRCTITDPLPYHPNQSRVGRVKVTSLP